MPEVVISQRVSLGILCEVKEVANLSRSWNTGGTFFNSLKVFESSHKIASKFPLIANDDISFDEAVGDIRANASTIPSSAVIIGKTTLISERQIKIRAPASLFIFFL